MNIFLIESKLWFQSSSLSDNKTFRFITHSALLISQFYQNKLKNNFSYHFFLGNFRKLVYFREIVNIELTFSGSWHRDYSSFWVKIVKERSGFIKMNKINRVNIRNVPSDISQDLRRTKNLEISILVPNAENIRCGKLANFWVREFFLGIFGKFRILAPPYKYSFSFAFSYIQ